MLRIIEIQGQSGSPRWRAGLGEGVGRPEGRRRWRRPPGRDGTYSGDSYKVGPFPPDEHDTDVVWADGYFVSWPAAS